MKIIVAVPQRAPKDLAGAGLPGPQRCPCPDSWTVNTIHGRKDFAGVMKVMDFRIGRVFLDYLGGPVFVQLEGRCRRQREESERFEAWERFYLLLLVLKREEQLDKHLAT